MKQKRKTQSGIIPTWVYPKKEPSVWKKLPEGTNTKPEKKYGLTGAGERPGWGENEQKALPNTPGR